MPEKLRARTVARQVDVMRTLFAIVAALSCGATLVACADNGLPPESAADLRMPPPEPPSSPDYGPAHALRRSAVRDVVSAGLGRFLQRVDIDVDHPVFVAGKFHGFRIASLRGDPRFWRGVDLRPGDVVVKVNGFGIERPDDAMQAFSSLEVASELKVEYEREGQPRELRFEIVDDGGPPPTASSAPSAMPSPSPSPSSSAPAKK
jgi:hypothetical protein